MGLKALKVKLSPKENLPHTKPRVQPYHTRLKTAMREYVLPQEASRGKEKFVKIRRWDSTYKI